MTGINYCDPADSGLKVMSVRKWLNSNKSSEGTAVLLQPGMTECSGKIQTLSLCFSLFMMFLSLTLFMVARALSLFPVLLLLSSSNLCIVPHPLWGHTMSSLGSSRGNTFCVRSAVEKLVSISGFSSFIQPPAERYSAVCLLFSSHLSLSRQAWTVVQVGR